MAAAPASAHDALRSRFRGRNALIGVALFGFCASVFTYSILAVKQEKFDDVEAMLDEKRKQRAAQGHTAART
ncbi:hypothetical protein GGF31_002211 [Allomyces arbusculus]|nr:hypothetical protein GGF31_002211 [Allomyces arbusculus]